MDLLFTHAYFSGEMWTSHQLITKLMFTDKHPFTPRRHREESPHSNAWIQTHDLIAVNHIEALYNTANIEQQTVCYS